ncbi:MAG: carboxypeptidase-like regulatory domain-containing protein [Phycisphaerales bacterium JB037]
MKAASLKVIGALAIALAAAFFLMPSAARADGPESPVRPALVGGVVLTDNGRPVPDAVVRLVRPNGRVIARTTTNDQGQFRFDGIRPGPVAVQAAKRDAGAGATRLVAEPGANRVRVVLGDR